MKKMISSLCSLAVFLTLFAGLSLPIKAFAMWADYTYEIVDGEAMITGYYGDDTNFKIPDTIDGYPVTTIGDYAFCECFSLVSVTIPDSVTTIGWGAFSTCASLESVSIGNSATTIGGYAFYGCTSLKSVTIPDSVTMIGYGAFSGCTLLESVTIPESVTCIGESAFNDCASITDVYYAGTKAQWNKITIWDFNDLYSAYIHYNTTAEHEWVLIDVYEEPSCVRDGLALYTCDCDYQAEFAIPAKGHTPQFIETVAPTCTEGGYDVYECAACLDTYYDNYTPPVIHLRTTCV